jgi:hypothetical protein
MQTKRETAFELLEPPPGGVERMRAKLAAPRRTKLAAPRQPRVRLGLAASAMAALGAAAVMVMAVLVALKSVAPEVPEMPATGGNAILAAPQFDRLLGRITPPLPLEVERDGEPVRIEPLPSTDPRVRIYRVLEQHAD